MSVGPNVDIALDADDNEEVSNLLDALRLKISSLEGIVTLLQNCREQDRESYLTTIESLKDEVKGACTYYMFF